MAETDTIPALVARLRREVEQARFAGDEPALVVAPDDPPAAIVAKTLAAERLNAPLRLGDALVPLQEDVAEALFYRGVTALRYWRFPVAQAAFEEAGAKTSAPVLQQRLALYRGAAALVRRTVLADPDRPTRAIPEERVLGLVDTLDALAPAERDHYRAELERLIALRRALPDDAYLQTVHGLLRARLALTAGDDALGLGWLLRAAARHADRLTPNPYLADLLARARRRLRRFLGDPEPPSEPPVAPALATAPPADNADMAAASHPAAGTHAPAVGPPAAGAAPAAPPPPAPADTAAEDDDVRASELLAALASHLDELLGHDVEGDAARFGIVLYHDE
jgi:hypothetical protein